MKLLLILVAATLSAQTPLPGPILGGTTGPQGPAGPAPSGTGAVQVTSGVAGLVAGTSSNCVLVNGTSAPCDAPGQGAISNVTPVTVSANVTSAQVLQQLSLTAGLLNVAGNSGGVYTYNGSGIYTAAALQTPTLTWTLNLCTVSGCGSGTVRALATIVTPAVVTATNNAWNIRLHIGNTATGATGTLITHGSAIVELTAASDLGTASSDSNTASSGTIDLTAALFLQLTVTTSTGNAGNSITEDHSSLEPASAIGPTGATGPTGTIPTSAPQWQKASVLYIANGTSTCANTNGCWQITNTAGTVTVVNAAAAASQNLTLTPTTAKMWVGNTVGYVTTQCTTGGSGLIIHFVGSSISASLFGTPSYSLTGAVANSNLFQLITQNNGTGTLAADQVVIQLSVTGTIDQTTAGCAFSVNFLMSNYL